MGAHCRPNFEIREYVEQGAGVRQMRPEAPIAPMPGRILEVLVVEGQEVTIGQPLMIMEAMKMEHKNSFST